MSLDDRAGPSASRATLTDNSGEASSRDILFLRAGCDDEAQAPPSSFPASGDSSAIDPDCSGRPQAASHTACSRLVLALLGRLGVTLVTLLLTTALKI